MNASQASRVGFLIIISIIIFSSYLACFMCQAHVFGRKFPHCQNIISTDNKQQQQQQHHRHRLALSPPDHTTNTRYYSPCAFTPPTICARMGLVVILAPGETFSGCRCSRDQECSRWTIGSLSEQMSIRMVGVFNE